MQRDQGETANGRDTSPKAAGFSVRRRIRRRLLRYAEVPIDLGAANCLSSVTRFLYVTLTIIHRQ